MQKFLKIAEQHVQWVALGLGLLYLLFMGWSYVYKSDINVALGPKPAVEPGEIDQTIAQGPVAQLEQQMSNPDPITIKCPDVLAGWNDHASEVAVDYRPLPGVWNSNPYGENGGGGPLQAPANAFALVDKLPELPPAIPVAVASYRTLAEVPDPAFVAPADTPDAKAPLIDKDIDAASVQFKIDMKALGKAFINAFAGNVRPEVFQTMYLKVTLLRQEWDPTTKAWGPVTEIPPLSINVSPDDPGLPADPAPQDKGLAYELYAGGHQELILHPPFYQTAAGAEPWTMPQPPAPAADAAAGAAGAGAAGAGAPGPGLPGFNVPGAGPPGPGFPRGFPQPGLPGYPQGGIRPPETVNRPPAFDQPAGGGWQGQRFNPSTRTTDEILVAHDDTVQPEKTYQYFIQYRMLNPVFAAPRLTSVKALSSQLALVSPGPAAVPGPTTAPNAVAAAAPTDKLTIPSRSQLFVKLVHGSSEPRSNEVHFAVFVFAPGPHETEVSATPGDSIAPTHWTLVDVRKSENPTSQSDYTVLLVDDNGNLQERDWHADQADQTQKDLHDRANGAVAPGAAALNN
jgi:hypothetical protein